MVVQLSFSDICECFFTDFCPLFSFADEMYGDFEDLEKDGEDGDGDASGDDESESDEYYGSEDDDDEDKDSEDGDEKGFKLFLIVYIIFWI